MAHPPDPSPSAIVILYREGEVYLVKRPPGASFFPGFYAFPGGGVEDEDGRGTQLDTLRATAVRELAEETTVELEPEALEAAGVVVTPPFSPIRYRTQFFLARVGEDVNPLAQEPELVDDAWTRPRDALDAWRAGEVKLPPPVLHALERLDEEGPDALVARGTREADFPITFLPGLRVEALEVRTLPPHTHTNAFVVGEGPFAVVDPGATGGELEPLVDTLHALEVGDKLAYVALTHHHEDHAAGAGAIAEMFDAEIAASPETAQRLTVDVDVILDDGERLDLGDHSLEAVATPGHAPGHLCFIVPDARTLLAGDLVAGVGTVLVPPGEGDMAAYMDSLEKAAEVCREQGLRLAFPAHGPPLFDPAGKLEATLDHRREREARVLDALAKTPRELEAIAEDAYADKPDAPEQLKQMSTRAHLAKLVDEERAVRGDEGWRRA